MQKNCPKLCFTVLLNILSDFIVKISVHDICDRSVGRIVEFFSKHVFSGKKSAYGTLVNNDI